jgi:hypothetical protein
MIGRRGFGVPGAKHAAQAGINHEKQVCRCAGRHQLYAYR